MLIFTNRDKVCQVTLSAIFHVPKNCTVKLSARARKFFQESDFSELYKDINLH